jgi:small subunit ribosomal protein S20
LANLVSAIKRARQAIKRRERNVASRSRMRTYVKNVHHAIDEGDKEAASKAYQEAVSMLDSSAAKGMIHANKAARQKSRLNARIKAM